MKKNKKRISIKEDKGKSTLIIRGLACFNKKRYSEYSFYPNLLGVFITVFFFPFYFQSIRDERSIETLDIIISASPFILLFLFGIIRTFTDKKGLRKTMTLTVDKSKAILEHKKNKNVYALSSIYINPYSMGRRKVMYLFNIKVNDKKIFATPLNSKKEFNTLESFANRFNK